MVARRTPRKSGRSLLSTRLALSSRGSQQVACGQAEGFPLDKPVGQKASTLDHRLVSESLDCRLDDDRRDGGIAFGMHLIGVGAQETLDCRGNLSTRIHRLGQSADPWHLLVQDLMQGWIHAMRAGAGS